MRESREQKLIDLCFAVGMHLHIGRKHWNGKSREDVADWIADQLKSCGFPTKPVGMSWGVLERESEDSRIKKIRESLEEAVLAIYEAGRLE